METENNNIEKEWGKEVFDLLSWYEMDRVKTWWWAPGPWATRC